MKKKVKIIVNKTMKKEELGNIKGGVQAGGFCALVNRECSYAGPPWKVECPKILCEA